MAGRKKKYHTDEEKREANRLKQERYYERHKEKIREKNKRRYHEKYKNTGE